MGSRSRLGRAALEIGHADDLEMLIFLPLRKVAPVTLPAFIEEFAERANVGERVRPASVCCGFRFGAFAFKGKLPQIAICDANDFRYLGRREPPQCLLGPRGEELKSVFL